MRSGCVRRLTSGWRGSVLDHSASMSKPVYQEPKEWCSCMKAGTAVIRRPYVRFPRRGLPSVVVYHLPSFRDCFAWSLFRQRESFHLQTVIWRQTVDARRLSDPMEGIRLGLLPDPTLEESFVPTDSAWCISQLQKLDAMHLSPFIPEGSIGMDGESFGVHIPYKVELEWWCSGPAAWGELISWTQEFIAQFGSPESGEQEGAGDSHRAGR